MRVLEWLKPGGTVVCRLQFFATLNGRTRTRPAGDPGRKVGDRLGKPSLPRNERRGRGADFVLYAGSPMNFAAASDLFTRPVDPSLTAACRDARALVELLNVDSYAKMGHLSPEQETWLLHVIAVRSRRVGEGVATGKSRLSFISALSPNARRCPRISGKKCAGSLHPAPRWSPRTPPPTRPSPAAAKRTDRHPRSGGAARGARTWRQQRKNLPLSARPIFRYAGRPLR